jgi:plastocyanin
VTKGGKRLKRYFGFICILALFLLLYSPENLFAGKIIGTVKTKGLRSPANVLVYLSGAPAVSVDLSKARFVIDQRNLTFIPHILHVLVGAEIQFPNNDQVKHNIFSLSRAKKFNLGSYGPGEGKTVLFGKPGVVQLRCDAHAEMGAYIIVMKNPYFTVTGSGGKFEIPGAKYPDQRGIQGIKGLAPGKYFIKTWHEKLKSKKQSVDVPEEGVVSVQFNLTRGRPGALYK